MRVVGYPYCGYKADIFSLGVILFSLLAESYPNFKNDDIWEEFDPPSRAFQDLVDRMLD